MSCGTGKDSTLLLSFGGKVLAFERNEVIYNLLCFYFHCLGELSDFPKDRLQLINGEFGSSVIDVVPDVIYFDPMYAKVANKKAAPRRQMQEFRSFVGVDNDYLSQFEKALAVAKNRVVLKRPIKSPIVMEEKCSHSIFGKSTRYDVYLVNI